MFVKLERKQSRQVLFYWLMKTAVNKCELNGRKCNSHALTFIALMADLVMEIILARDIGGFESINENNW